MTDDVSDRNSKGSLPSEFMRKRRPSLFSDLETVSGYRLDRSEFEYHLESLTSRSQFVDFEIFCRKLAEREISPNLRPQTGPVGGGDSKADTETYSVSDEIAENWYLGDNNGRQRKWAFAFSAKKDWKVKVKSDVKGLKETGRKIDKIIFITNQFAKDKDRAEIEESLKKAYKLKVEIHDRNWICERVFQNEHYDLAVDYLKVGSYDPKIEVVGPNDYRKIKQLSDIEKLFTKGNDKMLPYQKVEDSLISAKLSRSLEKPRFETDGRFLRAIDLADKYGTFSQKVEAIYEHIWTSYWWFDDFEKLTTGYDQLETLLESSKNALEIQLLLNLYSGLFSSVRLNHLTEKKAKLPKREASLRNALILCTQDNSRPCNCLEAKTCLIFLDLNRSLETNDLRIAKDCWKRMSEIIKQANNLGEFNVQKLPEMFEIYGEIFTNDEGFDRVFEELTEFVSNRTSEAEAAFLLKKRGLHKLEANRIYDAIHFFGRASSLLVKKEYEEELLECLYYLTDAYRRAGLMWAAKATCTSACAKGTGDLINNSDYLPYAIITLKLYCWISLQMGLIADFLQAFELFKMIYHNYDLPAKGRESVDEELIKFDLVLGCLFLNLPLNELEKLQNIPDILEYLHLWQARSALLYRTGHFDILRNDQSIPADVSDAEAGLLFEQFRDQPVREQVSDNLVLGISGEVLRTNVLGTSIFCHPLNGEDCIVFCHALLSTLEGFLATGLSKRMLAHTEKFDIYVEQFQGDGDVTYSFEPETMTAKISVPCGNYNSSFEKQKNYRNALMNVTINIMAHVIMIADTETTFEQLATEGAFDRALTFSITAFGYGKLFSRPFGTLEVFDDRVKQSYAILTDKFSVPLPIKLSSKDGDLNYASEIDIPKGIFDEHKSHNEHVALSVIDIPLWDKAKWSGTAFAHGRGMPPLMGFMFSDIIAGEKIFARWRERFGSIDESNQLRITIVQGISKKHPSHYKIVVSSEIPLNAKGKTMSMVSRYNLMTPQDTNNLTNFLNEFAKHEWYGIAPVAMAPNGLIVREDSAIGKSKLYIKQAWEIGPHDPEMIVLHLSDDVYIPPHIKNPPVTKAFERIKSKKC